MKTSEKREARSFMDSAPRNWSRQNATDMKAKEAYSVFSASQPNAPAWERLTEATREQWREVARIPTVYKCPECNAKLFCRECGTCL